MIQWIADWCSLQSMMDDVLTLDSICFPESSWDLTIWQGIFKNRAALIGVIFVDNQPTGFVAVTKVLDEAEIIRICVLPVFRRKGIGRNLMNTLFQTLSREKITRIYLEVRQRNIAAREFYSSQGFLQNGERKNYYDRPVDNAVLLSCEIP